MAADCVADGDYLGEYSRFFAEFVARVNPEDQLPVKVSVYDVSESELVGEIISVTLQYLNRTYCPPSLQSYIARLVIEAIKSTCKKQPEICGLRQQEKTYAPLKLMQTVTNEVNEICRRYLDNSRLALLPPPSSTPQVTVGATRNARRKMEDRHMILHDLNTMFNIQDDTIVDYYAVFDGHGGQDAAAYCATHLHQYLVESVHYPTDPESALRDAFLTTDAQFTAKSNTQKLNGGTTAVCALLINKKLYIAWVGDSMASLVTCGNVKQLVNPHRPTREDERERIRNMGGVVVHCMGVLRVNGFLSISRAIGDVPYKPFISGEPEVRCVPLDGTEDFLIIACDGLWDYVDQRTAALRVYRQVLQNPYDLKHIHQGLLQSAKRAGSLDNITVIIVFLTPPIEIASRNQLLTHQAPNGLLLNNMDPNNPIPSNHDQYDVKTPYIKQVIDEQVHIDSNRPDFPIDLLLKNSVCGVARNGKHQDDDDEEYDYTDVGPETDVDAGEDVHDNNYQALVASSSRDPSPEGEKSPMEIEKNDDDDRNDNNDYSNRENANVCSADSVVDDVDVDNRARPSDGDVRGADDEMLRDNGDDDARVETAGTDTVVDDDESPPSPRAAKPLQHALIEADNVADSEDSEDEWDYYRIDPNKVESAATAVAADESRKGVEEQSAQENLEPVAKDNAEAESPEAKDDIKCEELVKDSSSPELINIDISDERKSSESKKDQILLNLEEEKKEQDMDFQLNPEAAEFVPLSPPLTSNRTFLQDYPISGSPLKQTQVMDDIAVPSQSEFEKEVSHRPKEIDEDFSHDEQHPHNNSSPSMDTSEISSTKAEMGDDESMIVMSTSQWQADISSQWNEKTRDDAGSDLEKDDVVTKDNPLAVSLTAPGNLEKAFEKAVDLNAVHILDDSSDGAELVSTPPRSPGPSEDCAQISVSEDKNPIDLLCASTPQPADSISTTSSDASSDAKPLFSDYHIEGDFVFPPKRDLLSDAAKNVFRYLPGVEVGYSSSHSEGDLNCTTSTEKSTQEVSKENVELKEEENLCENEDSKDVLQASSIKSSAQSLQSLQITEEESIEFGVPLKLSDSTNHSNDAIHSGTEQTYYLTKFDSEKPILNPFTEPPFKIGDSQPDQSTDWTNFFEKTDKSMLIDTDSHDSNTECNFLNVNNPCCDVEEKSERVTHFERESETEELHNIGKHDNNEDDDDVKPDSTTELNPFDSMQELTVVKEQPQHESQSTPEQGPIEIETLIDTQTEQERTEGEAAEVAPTNVCEISTQEVIKEGFCSEVDDEPIRLQKSSAESSVESLDDVAKLKESREEVLGVPAKNEIPPTSRVVEEDFFAVDDDKPIVLQKSPETSLENIADESKKEVTGIVEAVAGTAVAATAVAAVASAAAAASPTKAKIATMTTTTTTAKRPTKTTTTKATAPTTKTATKSMPTSPSKAIGAAMRITAASSSAQPAARKAAVGTAARPKQLDGTTKAAISSAGSKTTVTKTMAGTKAATTTTKSSAASPRMSSSATKPRTIAATSSKVSTAAPIEKRSTMSGDAKPISKPAGAKPASAALRATTTSGASAKTTLVKTSSTTARTATFNVTSKPRPTSATSATKTTSISKQPATGASGASRPRTAPTSSGATKPRDSTGKTIAATTGKSPSIDKQSKETVNKQISRSGVSSAPKTSGRASTPAGTAAGVAKPRTPIGKSAGNASAISPTKKSTLTPKTASRTSIATKRTSTEAKVLQNGIAKEDETKTTAVITTMSDKPEDDVPRKDASPVNVPTDNQLIAD